MEKQQQLCELARQGKLSELQAAIDSSGPGPLSKLDDAGRLLIHWAALDPNGYDTLEYLRNAAPDTSLDAEDDLGWTPLMIAASAGRLPTVRKLLAWGAYPHGQNGTGNSALHYAASKNRPEIAKLLLDADVSPNTQDTYGATPLHRAASQGHDAVLSLLLSLDSLQPDLKNGEGNTALHLAVLEDRPDAVKALLRKGARMDIQNKEEKTALDLASAGLRRTMQTYVANHTAPA